MKFFNHPLLLGFGIAMLGACASRPETVIRHEERGPASTVPQACTMTLAQMRKNSVRRHEATKMVSSRQALQKLSPVERKALDAYIRKFDIRATFDDHSSEDDFELSVANLRNRSNGQLSGWRVEVSNGGDENSVAYYFTPRGDLLFWLWGDPRPETGWPCEGI